MTDMQAYDAHPVFNQPVLVVNQKAKLVEVTNQYTVSDASGTPIAMVQQVGQSKGRKLLRMVSNVDKFLAQRYEITDVSGQVLLHIDKPAKVIKSTVVVSDPSGTEIGRLAQQNAIGKIRFGIMSGEQEIGEIRAENWRAWNFSVVDASEKEVARISKKWEGLGKAMFTTADNYAVTINEPLQGPMRYLVVAAALLVDTALKQDE